MSLTPTADYVSTFSYERIKLTPGDGPHITDGKTTQISDVFLNAGGEDRDKPSKASDTRLGNLRAELTTLQDKINIFLTERIIKAKHDHQLNTDDTFENNVLDEAGESNDTD